MNVLIVGAVSILVFAVAFARLKTVDVARTALAHSRSATALVMDKQLSDDEKEPLVRKAAIGMFSLLGAITLSMAAVLAMAFMPVLLADRFGVAPMGTVTEWFVSPLGIFCATIGFAVSCLVSARRKTTA